LKFCITSIRFSTCKPLHSRLRLGAARPVNRYRACQTRSTALPGTHTHTRWSGREFQLQHRNISMRI
jgi:hypothetical protein